MGWTSQTISSAPDEETALCPLRFCHLTACLTPAQGWVTHIYMHIELPTCVFKWQNPCKHGKALTENCRSQTSENGAMKT